VGYEGERFARSVEPQKRVCRHTRQTGAPAPTLRLSTHSTHAQSTTAEVGAMTAAARATALIVRFIFVASLAPRRDLPAPRESIIPPRGLTAAWAAESLKGMPDRPETGRFHPGWRISLTQERRAQ
jgi:hypothetical protein